MMKIVLGGYFETALVRYIDEEIIPDRNTTTHPYYMCVNRKVPKAYFDRAATFVALSDQVIVPSIDWGMPEGNGLLTSSALGIHINDENEYFGREWDDETKVFSDILLDHNALSLESLTHVSSIDFAVFEITDEQEKRKLRRTIGHHYLCRLLLQIRASAETKAILVISENDLRVLRDVGDFMRSHMLAAPYSIPDISSHMIEPESFASGLLNFSPPDALALVAVKQDALIQKYAARIAPDLRDLTTTETQRRVLQAMKDAYGEAEQGRKAQEIFEIVGRSAKPLRLVPGVDAALSLAEDVKEMAGAWAQRKVEDREWYLLGAKMSNIAIDDYLSRKGNFL